MTPFLPLTTKTTIRSEKRVNINLFRNEKKVVFLSRFLPPAVVVQSVCRPFFAHSRFFPHRNKRFYNCLKKQREILERRQNTLCDKIEKNFGIEIAEDDRVLIVMKNCFERLLFRNLFFSLHGEGPKRLHDWLHAILFEAFPVCRSLESRAGVQNFIVNWRRCPKFFFQRRSTANRINETVAVR